MVPLYNLVVDITANAATCEEEFRELLAPCTALIEALSGAVRKKSCNTVFYPPDPQSENSKEWSARLVALISVGRARGEYLAQLCGAIVRLIAFELPDFEVRAEVAEMKFS